MIEVNYRPQDPKSYNPPIGLIGCGGITKYHLEAYRNAGYQVVALCDLRREMAEKRAQEFFPDAKIFTDYAELLRQDDIEVLDVATHPPDRPAIIRDGLLAGKHILSQKPFVLDLDKGQELVDLADRQGVRLAVNQNGRWAPHFAYARAAVQEGLLGEISAVHMSVHWDHTWTKGTEFENVKHLILYDFAIHWFDMVSCLLAGQQPLRVYASVAKTKRQTLMPPLLGQVLIEFEHAQSTLAFDADTSVGKFDRTFVTGSKGSLLSVGPDIQEQAITLDLMDGDTCRTVEPKLTGKWFPDGFHGTMGELLCSIEEDREPTISAAKNLQSLSLCFAAVASAETHQPQVPGQVRKMPG